MKLRFKNKELLPKDIARCLAKIDASGGDAVCHPWISSLDDRGYGHMVLGGGSRKRRTMARGHRLIWLITNGNIPAGMHVLHSCDNPRCCNPKHLFLGTHLDNMRDKAAKGRAFRPAGEKHGASKLTECIVREMRELYAAGGVTFTELGARYGVRWSAAHHAVRRLSWRHVS